MGETKPKSVVLRRIRRLKAVDLAKIRTRLLVALERESTCLMDATFAGKLSEEDSKSLINYLKLLRDLQRSEADELDNLSDEELEKLVSQNK